MPLGDDADLDIFAVGSCKSVILAVSLMMYGSERGVEALSQIPGQLQVLALVLADRHRVGLVQQDVRGLQDRVGEQPNRRPVRALLGGLVLELGHPARLAEPGDAAQHPGQLRVLGHLRLDEQGAPVWVQTQGEQLRRTDPGPLPQHRRIMPRGDRVQVHHAVVRVVGLLEGNPVAERPEVVAQVERACGRLDAGEDAGTVGHALHSGRPV